MGAKQFGSLVDEVMQTKGITQARLAVLVGVLPDGRVLNETQIRRIREGQRRLDHELIRRLIEVLDLDPYTAWIAAGMTPPRLRPEHLRRLDEQLRSEGATVICGYLWSPAHTLQHERLVPGEPLAVAA